MMKAGWILVFALSLAACGRQEAISDSRPQADASAASSEQERCAHGGMDAANDPRCKAASDAQFRKFMNGGGSDEHRSR
jgi:conjugative transfer region protein TrbK